MTSTQRSKVGIVGAGVIGRLLALRFDSLGWEVFLFDQLPDSGENSCSFAAAGMLAPFCEMDSDERIIFSLGAHSLALWEKIIAQFSMPIFLQKKGSLIVAHPLDLDQLERFRRNINHKIGECFGEANVHQVSADEIQSLEPQLDRRYLQGMFFPNEGQIDAREFLSATSKVFKHKGIHCRFNSAVAAVVPHKITSQNEDFRFDLVVDCRGLKAQGEWPELRAVRGELIYVEAPDVQIQRPLRLLHPRYPLYVVPRPNHKFIIGATAIESDDAGPITVRSTLELLSAAYALNSSFSEAKILQTVVGLRPTLPDHRPCIRHQPGLIAVNGLYRHGYLISPKLSELVCEFALHGNTDPEFKDLFKEVKS